MCGIGHVTNLATTKICPTLAGFSLASEAVCYVVYVHLQHFLVCQFYYKFAKKKCKCSCHVAACSNAYSCYNYIGRMEHFTAAIVNKEAISVSWQFLEYQ